MGNIADIYISQRVNSVGSGRALIEEKRNHENHHPTVQTTLFNLLHSLRVGTNAESWVSLDSNKYQFMQPIFLPSTPDDR